MAKRKKRPAQPRGSSKSERNKFQVVSSETLTTGEKYRKKIVSSWTICNNNNNIL